MRRLSAGVVLALVVVMALGLAPAVAGEQAPDDRARVSFVEGMIDAEGELWFKVGFYAPWDEKPPSDLFSFFFFLGFSLDGSSAGGTGWEVHDGTPAFLGSPGLQAYILDNGCVIVSTGIFPSGEYSVGIDASFGSWLMGADAAVFGDTTAGTSSEFISMGDPLTDFGGSPVFDLATQEMLAAPTTTSSSTTTTTTTTAGDSATGDSTTTTTEAPIRDPGSSTSILIGSDGLSLLAILLGLLFAFGLVFLIGWMFGWWMFPWLGFPPPGGYAARVRERLGGGGPIPPKDPHDGTETPRTGTGSDYERGTGTSGSQSRTTGTTGEGDDGDDEPEAFDDREPPKPDCEPLRIECERLKQAAADAKIAADSAEQRASDAEAACERARQRISDLQERVSDLEGRDDAPQRYQRLTEAQRELRDAEAGVGGICDAVEPLRGQATESRAEAQRLQAEAAAACRRLEECEAQQ